MCGICGFFGMNAPPDGEGVVRAMTGTMPHRGPDDAGHWADPAAGVALGQRRLAIIDLSPLGHQPMFSASGRYAVVYNGEVYNFRELRSELEPLGHPFRGGSDTEVLLAAVEQWGLEGALPRLTGMFAFALWDARERELTLVRDRLGIKPLYYGLAGGTLVFGSELKALRAFPAFPTDIDRDALTLYFRHGYIPAPRTVHASARKLLPGHALTVRADGTLGFGDLAPRAWWDAAEVWRRGMEDPFAGGVDEAADELEALLADAVRLRMIADVPLGALLSGGIDSSAVAAFMQRAGGRTVKTFSVGFHEPRHDEAGHARRVAEHLGTEHTELYVTPRDLLDAVPVIPRYWDEPFADSSQIPTSLVFKLARPHVTVALSGDGGDELFAGYQRYRWGAWWGAVRRVPWPLRKAASLAMGLVPGRLWALAGERGQSLGWRGDLLGEATFGGFYRNIVSHFKDPAGLVLGGQEPPGLLAACDGGADPDLYRRMQCMDLAGYLPDDILAKVDRASMAVSLEARVPLLDHRIVAFAARLTTAHNVRGGVGKQVLRRVLYRHVPRELVDRPKMGFAVPMGRWLGAELRDWAEALLDESALRGQGLLDPVRVRSLWRRYLRGERNWWPHLWDVLMLQAWMEEYGT